MTDQENKTIKIGKVLWRYRTIIIGSALFCGIIALIVSFFVPKVYEAKSTLLIMPSKYQTEVQPTAFSTPTYQGLLDNREITKEIIDQLGLKEMTVELLQKEMTTKIIIESQPRSIYTPVIDLIVHADNPQIAAAIANKWAELFVGRTEHLSSREIDRTYQLLTTQLDSTKRNLSQAQDNVKLLREKYKLTNMQSEMASILQQLNGVTSGTPAQPNYSQFSALNVMTFSFLPTPEPNQQQGYRGLYISLVYALNTVENKLKQSDSQLSPEERQQLQSYASSLKVQINELTKTISQLEKGAQRLAETIVVGESELVKMQQDADNFRKNYSLLFDKTEQAKIAKAEQVEDIKIFAKAIVPEQPIWPRKSIITLIAALVGLFVSAGFVLTKEYFNTIQS